MKSTGLSTEMKRTVKLVDLALASVCENGEWEPERSIYTREEIAALAYHINLTLAKDMGKAPCPCEDKHVMAVCDALASIAEAWRPA